MRQHYRPMKEREQVQPPPEEPQGEQLA
jgi:hypothetical protein